MELKDVLKDRAKFADNLAWTLGDGAVVTLGQLRALDTSTQAAISAKDTEMANRETELKKAQVNTANLYTTVNAALLAIQEGRLDDPSIKALYGDKPLPSSVRGASGNNNHNDDPFAVLSRLENDALMGPVVVAMRTVRDEAKKAQDAVAATTETQKRMATNYLNGVLEDRYDRLVPADKQDKITLQSLIQTAVQQNQFAADSTPNIKWAYKHLTAGDTRAEEIKAAREDERKKVLAEQSNAGGGAGGNGIFVPQPATYGLDVHNRSGQAPKAFANLDEAFAAAAKDSSIWSQVDAAN